MNQTYPQNPAAEEKLPRMFAQSWTAASATVTSPAVGYSPLPASLEFELCPACQGDCWAGEDWCYCPVGSQLAAEDRAWRIQFTWQQAAIPSRVDWTAHRDLAVPGGCETGSGGAAGAR